MSRTQRRACSYLDVWMEMHERPLAVLAVDPQGKLHLLVQHDKNLHSLLLSEIKEKHWHADISAAQPISQVRRGRGSGHAAPAGSKADRGHSLLLAFLQIHPESPRQAGACTAQEKPLSSRGGLSTDSCAGLSHAKASQSLLLTAATFSRPLRQNLANVIHATYCRYPLTSSFLLLRAAPRFARS